MTVTYQNIFDDVCLRLDNDLEPKSTSFTGDGVVEILHLPHKGVCAGTNAPTVYTVQDGTGTIDPFTEGPAADYTMDYQSGYLYLATHVDTGYVLYVDYSVRHWSEQLLWRLINAGLHWLYPQFYATAVLTPTVDENTGDYPLVDAGGRIVGGVASVEVVSSSGTYRLRPFVDYRVVRGAVEAASLRVFPYVSDDETLNVTVGLHPAEFATTSTTLASLGLPDRMREPLVLYTCWQALVQKMPSRSRQDNVGAAAQEGKTTFFDQVRMSQTFKMLLDTELAHNKMRSWAIRGL